MKILHYPHRKLKKVCKPVDESRWPAALADTATMAELMFDKYTMTMPDGRKINIDGVGVAAPQIGSNIRAFVMSPKHDPKDITHYFNPKITNHGREVVTQDEMCLSCPGSVRAMPRWAIIEVEYQNENQETITRKLTRWEARVFQHSLDHLDGVVCMYKEGGP